MTQTNQNKDYSWLREAIRRAKHGEDGGIAEDEAIAAIQAHIDEHYIGKGEAKPPISGELELVEEFAPDDDPTCASCGFGEWRHTNTHPCAKYVPRKGTRLYTESEVEQRCIEARIEQMVLLRNQWAVWLDDHAIDTHTIQEIVDWLDLEIAWHENKNVKSAHKHRSGPEVYLSNPPQYKCIDCGETFFAPQLSTNNKDTLERSE